MAETGTRSVDRGIELVRHVIRANRPLTFTDLVAVTRFPRSTVSRLLGALEQGGLLERLDDGSYRGGTVFVEYAERFDRAAEMARRCRPELESLAESTGETVNLAMPIGGRVAHIDQVAARYVVGTVDWVGVEVPDHCSALGKVLIAWGGVPTPSGRLEVRTPMTLSTHASLATHLAEVRRRGVAMTRGELEEGLYGVAAPILDQQGRAVAALGVSGPAFRIAGKLDDLAELTRRHADRLSDVGG